MICIKAMKAYPTPRNSYCKRVLNKYKYGFTLAEVLITLGIIGVVAALTMPALIAKYTDIVTTVKLKKTYSILQNAFKMAEEKNGPVDSWSPSSNYSLENQKIFWSYFIKELKVSKECGPEKGCFYPKSYQCYHMGSEERSCSMANFDIVDYFYKIQLIDGVTIAMYVNNPYCTTNTELSLVNAMYANNWCGSLIVDINGYAKPNMAGRDLFEFDITKHGIFPSGLAGLSQQYVLRKCMKENGSGLECTAWILEYGNTKYPSYLD